MVAIRHVLGGAGALWLSAVACTEGSRRASAVDAGHDSPFAGAGGTNSGGGGGSSAGGGTAGSGGTPADAAPDAPEAGPFVPAPHDLPPTATSAGGDVLANPLVVPVFFPNDPLQLQIEGSLAAIAASTYWTTTTAEYGVGSLTIAPSVNTTDVPPGTVVDLDAWVATLADGGHAPWPAATADTLYAIYLPPGASVTDPDFGDSCVSYGGYHYETQLWDGTPVVYAIMPRCDTFGGLNGIEAVTATTSHELIEAATDPHALSAPAYSGVDDPHFVWNVVPLGEVADLCVYDPRAFQRLVGPYVVQRTWSNLAAQAGHDPCVPALPGVYFNSVPDQPDDVTVDYRGFSVPTRGVKLAIGESRTIEVRLFSEGPRGTWSVQAQDADAALGGGATLSFGWDSQFGSNGDVLHLTITRDAAGSLGGSEFILWSQDGNVTSTWFGYVGE